MPGPAEGAPPAIGAEVWTNLANALALQATERPAAPAAVAKKGFDAFPVTTQQMVLFASERDEHASARANPVDTYTEILGLANAAYVAQHLHHHLKSRLKLDVLLPAGFCSAVRMASFIASTSDRPEAFSLFACAPQPLTRNNTTTADNGDSAADDLMRMQLKVTDSTTGLSDKDVKRLTIVPNSFPDLAALCENMAGVTELVFGLRSPVTTMLPRLGWFIERRLQQYLTACAAADHIDDVSVDLFAFHATRQQLEDGVFIYPLCAYLHQAKLGPKKATPAYPSPAPASSRSGQPDDVVTNPNGRLTRQDDWQVFLDRAADAPIPNIKQQASLGSQLVVHACKKPESEGNAAKKPKVVGQRDSYLTAPTSAFQPSSVVSPDIASPAHHSPAARLHASRSSTAPPSVPLPGNARISSPVHDRQSHRRNRLQYVARRRITRAWACPLVASFVPCGPTTHTPHDTSSFSLRHRPGASRPIILHPHPGFRVPLPSPTGPVAFASSLWPRFLERITLGAQYPLAPIPDADRFLDVTATLARGNHKSARGHEPRLIEMLKDEVKRGWQLPLPIDVAMEIPHCELAPLGMVVQSTIGEDGSREIKHRLTHDQSFNSTKGARRSVNDRVDTQQLTPARFGRALLRFLHFVCYLRRRFPDERLLLTKVDCKSAYRRIHLQPLTAAKSCTAIAGMMLMALCMTFGGAPNPSQWSDVLEVIADLANDLVRRMDWDPVGVCAPQQFLLESPSAVDNNKGFVVGSEAFAPAFEMSVCYPTDDCLPRFECYLDNLFGVCREVDSARASAAVPLALHLVGRPVLEGVEESFPRDDLLAVSKFLAEARPSERKVILGWVINTRSLVISLPADKHRAWVDDLRKMRRSPGCRASSKMLESTVGRLNHAAYVIPNARHFLGRLYRASERAKAVGSVKLSDAQVDDIILWEKFLNDAVTGISLNRVVCRWPTRVVRVDACPQGMGGYCMQSGFAWRLKLEPDLIGRGSLNSLEFLAALVGVMVEHQFGDPWRADDVLLCQGDSSSATGWIAHSSFGDECPLHLVIARMLASYLMEHEMPHYAQWFPGKENSIADVLSRDFHLTDSALTSKLFELFSPQLTSSFQIITLPEAITTCVGNLLLDRAEQIDLFSCFAAAIREGLSVAKDAGRAAGSCHGRQASTVRATLDGVAQAFRAYKLSSPVHESRGRLEPILAAQLKGYDNDDPETAQQQAVPAAVISIASRMKSTNLGEAVGQLLVTAFFFAMRSCEYSTVQGNRRTVPIHLGDVEFRRSGRILRSWDAAALWVADTVSVVYRTQKNGDRGTIVTQHRTVTNKATDPLCPVRALAQLVARIASYEVGETNKWENITDRPINIVRGERTPVFTEITSTQVLHHLRAAAIQYGDNRLGFPLKKLGTHSIRSGAATALYPKREIRQYLVHGTVDVCVQYHGLMHIGIL
ncbi:hypothetical protein MHU86_14538 [Fragilaria crotonensis]|nr:hypothetical protein MHU86_14538 [Fragilaria crotonensis]